MRLLVIFAVSLECLPNKREVLRSNLQKVRCIPVQFDCVCEGRIAKTPSKSPRKKQSYRKKIAVGVAKHSNIRFIDMEERYRYVTTAQQQQRRRWRRRRRLHSKHLHSCSCTSGETVKFMADSIPPDVYIFCWSLLMLLLCCCCCAAIAAVTRSCVFLKTTKLSVVPRDASQIVYHAISTVYFINMEHSGDRHNNNVPPAPHHRRRRGCCCAAAVACSCVCSYKLKPVYCASVCARRCIMDRGEHHHQQTTQETGTTAAVQQQRRWRRGNGGGQLLFVLCLRYQAQ